MNPSPAKTQQALPKASHRANASRAGATLLSESAQALQDWITTYASDNCSPESVKEARERIARRGGTITYAAELSQRLREASENVQDMPRRQTTNTGDRHNE